MPRTVGRYELLDVVGRGGVGEVWRARDTELDRTVAVKLLLNPRDEDLVRFRREAQVTARLSHPNVAQVHEFGEDGAGTFYIAMQFVDGRPIDRVENARSRVECLRDAARAVEFANRAGVLHRDLKPANILVDAADRAYVVDFGLAREVSAGSTAMSLTGDVLGTPSYMSPEQARGDVRALDARTDVYGLGATLYALLEGRPPHTGPSAYDVIEKVRNEDPAPPKGDVGVIAMKALEKDPARRYESAAAFADDLDRWLRGETIVARPASAVYRLRKQIARRPAIWALGTLLAAAAAFGAVWLVRALRAEQAARMVEADARARAVAEARVAQARARLAEPRTALYIDGGSLAPYLDRVDGVIGECEAAMRESGDEFAEAWYWIGRARALYGDLDGAIEAYESATGCGDAPGHVWAELGRTRLERGILDSMAVGIAPDVRQSMLHDAADAAAEAYERAEATGWAAEGIERDVALAYQEAGRDDFAAAAQLAREALARWGAMPGAEELELLLGWVTQGDESMAHYDAALAIRPGFDVALVLRANERVIRGDMPGARADLDRAIAVNPRRAEAYFNRGNMRYQDRDAEGAREDFDRAIELNPRHGGAYVNRGNLRRIAGDLEGALADYDRAIEINPEDFIARASRAIARRQAGDLAAAAEDLREVLRLAPIDWPGRSRVEGMLREMGDY